MKTLQKWKPSRGIDLKGNFSGLFLETMEIIDTTTWTSRKGKIICFRWPYSKGSMLHFKFFPARFILFISLYLGKKILLSLHNEFPPGLKPFLFRCSLHWSCFTEIATHAQGLFTEAITRGLLHWPVWPGWNFLSPCIFQHGLSFSQDWNFFRVIVNFISREFVSEAGLKYNPGLKFSVQSPS